MIHSMKDGDFEVKFGLEFRMGFKGSNNLALPRWHKANRLSWRKTKHMDTVLIARTG